MECWEYQNCSNQAMKSCPAYPDNGKNCWKVTGTMCEGGRVRLASMEDKIRHCQMCEFYVTHANRN